MTSCLNDLPELVLALMAHGDGLSIAQDLPAKSAMCLWLASCLALTLLAWAVWRNQRGLIRRHGQALPRPPRTLPLIGNGLWFLQPRHRLLEWLSDCEAQFGRGSFEIQVPTLPPAIVINCPINVEHVLKASNVFVKGPFFRSRSWDLFGNGIINADGELWAIQRKAGLRFLSNANLKSFTNEVLPTLWQDTRHQLNQAVASNAQLDLQDLLLELTTRFMGKVAYDMDMPASLPFSRAFDHASGVVGARFQRPFWRIEECLYGGHMRAAVRKVKTFGAAIVARAAASRARYTSENPDFDKAQESFGKNLITSLLDHLENHDLVADAAMNYLSAGRDTVAQALTWTIYLLLRHPDVKRRLAKESKRALSKHSSYLLPFEDISPDKHPYIMAVFYESLRLYPPVPVEIKESTSASVFPDGTFLPQGSLVIWSSWAMGRSKETWGPDASSFRPDRWLENVNEALRFTPKTAFEFPVFNGGPRSCIGKRMAETLALQILSAMFCEFDFQEQGDLTRPRISQNSLTLPMAGGLPVTVTSCS